MFRNNPFNNSGMDNFGFNNPGYNNAGYGNYTGYTPAQAPIPQPPQINTNKIFVNGIEDARNRALPPNSDFTFLDNDKPLLYQKVVDGKGQFEITVYDIIPHKGAVQKDDTVYVSKDEFDKQITELKQTLAKLGGISDESVK